jgi:hypothetical protein
MPSNHSEFILFFSTYAALIVLFRYTPPAENVWSSASGKATDCLPVSCRVVPSRDLISVLCWALRLAGASSSTSSGRRRSLLDST